MKKDAFIHFAVSILFLGLITLFRRYFSLSYWPFWVGGMIGTIIPDIDHLIYVLFLSPQELTSRRVSFLIDRREFGRVVSLLYETRNERKNLVFHSFLFHIIFLIFAFLIISSSGSLIVKGIVIAFLIHLSVDQIEDVITMKNLSNWGQLFSAETSYRNSLFYIVISFLLVCIMGFLM